MVIIGCTWPDELKLMALLRAHGAAWGKRELLLTRLI